MSTAEKVCLVKIKRKDSTELYVLDAKEFNFGRSLEATFCELDPSVSRNHLIVTIENESIQYKDLDTANGTFLNGEKIAPNQWHSYKMGETLNVGSDRVVVSFDIIEKKMSLEEHTKKTEEKKREELERQEQDRLSDEKRAKEREEIDLQDQSRREVILKEISELENQKNSLQDELSKEILETQNKVKELLNNATVEARETLSAAEHKAREIMDSFSKERDEVLEAHAQIQSKFEAAEKVKEQITANTRKEVLESTQKDALILLSDAQTQAEQIIKKAEEFKINVEELNARATQDAEIIIDDAHLKSKILLQTAEKEGNLLKSRLTESLILRQRELDILKAQTTKLKNDTLSNFDEQRAKAQHTYEEIVKDAEKQAQSLIEQGKAAYEELREGAIKEGRLLAEEAASNLDIHLYDKRKQLKELQNQIVEAESELYKKQNADQSLNKEFELKLNILSQENSALLEEKRALTDKLNQIVVQTQSQEYSSENASMNFSHKSDELIHMETALKEKSALIEKMTADFEETQRHMEEMKNQHIQESLRQQNLVKEELAEIRAKEIQSLRELRDSELKSLSQLRNSGFLQIKDKTKILSEDIAHNLKFVLAKDFPQNAPILNSLENAIMQVIEDGLNHSNGTLKPEKPPIPKTPDVPKLVPSGLTNHGVNLGITNHGVGSGNTNIQGPPGTPPAIPKISANTEITKPEKKSAFASLKERFKSKKKTVAAAVIILAISGLAYSAYVSNIMNKISKDPVATMPPK